MIGWFSRVFGAPFRWLDLVSRIEELERRWRDLELEWENQYDKLLALQKRANKRVQDQAASLEEAFPTAAEQRLARREKIRALRQQGS